MAEHSASMDPRELEEAFSLFTEASKQLSDAYADLQQQVEFLTKQLEIANGNLRRELEEKSCAIPQAYCFIGAFAWRRA